MTDADGNVVTIERDSSTQDLPIAIDAPGGQRTVLGTTSVNRLGLVVDPAGDEYQLAYDQNGLLTSLTNPNGGQHKFAYDALQLLTSDSDPAGGYTLLGRQGTDGNFLVSTVTAEGSTGGYRVQNADDGSYSVMSADSAGNITTQNVQANGTEGTTAPELHGVIQRHAADERAVDARRRGADHPEE